MGLVLCAGFVAGIAARAQVQHFGVDMVLSVSFCELKDDLFDAAKAVRVVSLEKMQNAQAVSPVVRGSSPAGRQRSPERQCHPQDGIVTIIGAGKSLGIVMIVGLHGRFQARP